MMSIMSEAQRVKVTSRRTMDREQVGNMCPVDQWEFYAQAAAIAYKSEDQISSWRANSDHQFKEFLSKITAGPFKSKRLRFLKRFFHDIYLY